MVGEVRAGGVVEEIAARRADPAGGVRRPRNLGGRFQIGPDQSGRDLVIGLLRGQQGDGAVPDADAIDLVQIGIGVGLSLCPGDEDESRGLVETDHAPNSPVALGELALLHARRRVIDVEMAASVALGEPDHLTVGEGIGDRPLAVGSGLHKRPGTFRHDRAGLAGRRIDGPQAHGLVVARTCEQIDLATVR